MAGNRPRIESANKTLPRTLLRYRKGVGGVSLILGVAGLFQGPEYFWVFAALVYFGLAVFTLDVLFEPWPEAYRSLLRWLGAFLMLLLAVAFSFGVVLVKAPLSVTAYATNAEPPTGTKIANIPWRPEFSELEVIIENPTSRNYDDISIVLKPNFPVAAVGQITDLPGVSFEDRFSTNFHFTLKMPGKVAMVPLVRVATDAGYRVRCMRLPARTNLKIAMAVVDMKWNPTHKENEDFGVLDKDYLLRIQSDGDGGVGTDWFGHQDGLVYAPRVLPTYLSIDGVYVAAQRKRTIFERKDILNMSSPANWVARPRP
jgi:hypothetical protein